MDLFFDARDLEIESPMEGFYIRRFQKNGHEIQIWEIHAGVKSELRSETKSWTAVAIAGELELSFSEGKKNLFPMDIFILPPGQGYRFKAIGDRSARIVLFRTDSD